MKVSINPFMRASNDSEAIQSKFWENSISVKFSLKTCLCSSLIVVYINKDQILCSASDGEEKKTFRETLNWNNFIHDLIVSNWKKYSSKYSWFTPPLCSSGVPWKLFVCFGRKFCSFCSSSCPQQAERRDQQIYWS